MKHIHYVAILALCYALGLSFLFANGSFNTQNDIGRQAEGISLSAAASNGSSMLRGKTGKNQATAEYSPVASVSALPSSITDDPGPVQSNILASTPLAHVKTRDEIVPREEFTDAYIIELTSEPLAVLYGKSKDKNGIQNSLKNQKSKIASEQSSLLAALPSSVKKKLSASNDKKGPQQFDTVLNAVVLDMESSDIPLVQKLRNVKSIQRVRVVHADLMDSVPLIKAPQVWSGSDGTSTTTPSTGSGVTIAIIDTGIDYTHPDLGGCFGVNCKVAGGWDFVNNDADPMDDMGHGTHVADIAAGNGNPKGVAPGATLYAYKVLNSGGGGTWTSVIAGIERATDPNDDGDLSDHLDIASLSLGGNGNPDDPASTAVNNAVLAGVVVTIAAGNSGSSASIGSPGTAQDAITVGATDKNDQMAEFSSRGPVKWLSPDGLKYLTKPDVTAPGVNICAAQWANSFPSGDPNCHQDSNHVAISGTSMATPHVAGEAALLLQLHPDWTPAEIKSVIRKTAVSIQATTGDGIFATGYGRIDTWKASKLKRPPIAQIFPIAKGGGILPIRGNAQAQNISSYKLFFGAGPNPTTFTELYTGNTNVVNGVLYSNFDTVLFSEGLNTLRLVVTDTSGQTSEDRLPIEISNMEITAVGNTINYVNGGYQQIRGKIKSTQFSNFKITLNSPTGQVLCAGTAIAQGDVLCSANFSGLQNNTYMLYLQVQYGDIWKIAQPFTFAVIRELVGNWPQQLYGFPRGNPDVANFDVTQKKHLVIPYFDWCVPGECGGFDLKFYDSSGSMSTLSYLSNGKRVPSDSLLTIYNNAATKKSNIIGVDPNGSTVFTKSGEVFAAWKNQSNFESVNFTTLFDRNGDAIPEIYNNGIDMLSGDMKIHGHDVNGNVLKGFPVAVPRSNSESFVANHIVFLKGANSGDQPIDSAEVSPTSQQPRNNVLPSMIVLSGDYRLTPSYYMADLRLFAQVYQGEIQRTKSTLLYDGNGKEIQFYLAFEASADLNGDGQTEMVVAFGILDLERYRQSVWDPLAYTTYIKVLNAQGEVLKSKTIQGYLPDSLVIGKMNRNARPSIVAMLSETYATYGQGAKIMGLDVGLNTLFEKNQVDYGLGNDLFMNQLLMGDIDGDATSEIISLYRDRFWNSGPSGLLILDSQASLKRNIKIPTLGAVEYLSTPPVLDDFDADGKVDVLIQSEAIPKGYSFMGTEFHTNLFVLNLEGAFNPANMSWPRLLHDTWHTGCFGCISTTTASTSQALPSIKVLKPNGGETIEIGSFSPVEWTSNGVPSTAFVDMSLSKNTNDIPDQNEFNFTLQNYGNIMLNVPDTVAAGTYYLSIRCHTRSECKGDSSDSTITLHKNLADAHVVGNPSLTLQYDSANHESTLVSMFDIQINANNKDEYIRTNGAFYSYVRTEGEAYNMMYGDQEYNQISPPGSPVQGYYLIPANTSAVFRVRTTIDPRKMFAGSYVGKIDSVLLRTDASFHTVSVTPPNTTNAVTIVGELSPYINTVTYTRSGSSKTITIEGIRFGTDVDTTVHLESKTVVKDVQVRSQNGTILKFTTDIPDDIYVVQVTHPTTGASNYGYLPIGDAKDLPTVSLIAVPSSVVPGQASLIKWTATGAQSCVGDYGDGSRPPLPWRTPNTRGVWQFVPTKDTKLILTCKNNKGSSSASVTVRINEQSAPLPISPIPVPIKSPILDTVVPPKTVDDTGVILETDKIPKSSNNKSSSELILKTNSYSGNYAGVFGSIQNLLNSLVGSVRTK